MRIRSVLFSLATCAGVLVSADAASALTLGPVSVPGAVPPISVSVPPAVKVGPVVVPVGRVAPGLGATVTVSSSGVVHVGATLPTAIGSLPLPLLGSRPVQVTVGAGAPAPGTPVGVNAPGGPSTPVASGSSSRAPTSGPARATKRTAPAATPRPVNAARGSGTHATVGESRRPGAAPAATIAQPDGTLNASLRYPAPQGAWFMLRAVASAHGLWILLAGLIVFGRLLASARLRGALRRARSVAA